MQHLKDQAEKSQEEAQHWKRQLEATKKKSQEELEAMRKQLIELEKLVEQVTGKPK